MIIWSDIDAYLIKQANQIYIYACTCMYTVWKKLVYGENWRLKPTTLLYIFISSDTILGP